jgi:hypothetical protein
LRVGYNRITPYLAVPNGVQESFRPRINSFFPDRRTIMKWSWWLAAVLCSSSLLVFAEPNNPASKEPAAAESILVEFAEEVQYARSWLGQHNDITSVVEILNSLKDINQARVETSFQRALKLFFPKSRRLVELEGEANRKLARFFNYYHLQGKIEVRVFSLNYPMAFNTGQIVGVSNLLVEGWDDEEFTGIVAHELGHIIAQTQERITDEVPPDTKAYQRAEEIKADWVAMMMFRSAGLDPKSVITGLERIVPRSQYKRAGPLHPPMAVRLLLMREWLGLPRQQLRLRDAMVRISSPAGKKIVAQQ